MNIVKHSKSDKLYAVSVCRVSTEKQDFGGTSLQDQVNQIELARQRIENQFKSEIEIIKNFELAESASVEFERQPLQKVLTYCKASDKPVRFVFIKSLDRFTRAGATVFGQLQVEFSKLGINLIDTLGVLGGNSINTLEHLGLSYSWSIFDPSQITQLLEAERGKSEVRDIQTRMLGASIRYVRLGYWRGSTQLGYKTERKETEHGKRLVLKPHDKEAPWIIAMFTFKAQGMSDYRIVDEVNKMGFVSRKKYYRDRENRNKIIKVRGGIKLNVKNLRKYLTNPIYAGVNTEKWTIGNPVKLKEGGLVSIELFNKANAGKCYIEDSAILKVYKGAPPKWQTKKMIVNPLYPYKQYVLCPLCCKPLSASASQGKSGKHYPAYHCSKGHRYYRINMVDFDKTIKSFIKRVRFSDKFIYHFETEVLDKWDERLKQINENLIDYHKVISDLREEKKALEDKIRILHTVTAIRLIEGDLVEVENKIEAATVEANNKQTTELDSKVLVNFAKYFIEHFDELVESTPDPIKRAAIFGMIFAKVPTYEELRIGTPELSPLFKLNKVFNEAYQNDSKFVKRASCVVFGTPLLNIQEDISSKFLLLRRLGLFKRKVNNTVSESLDDNFFVFA